jgi:hypothetical protein
LDGDRVEVSEASGDALQIGGTDDQREAMDVATRKHRQESDRDQCGTG